MDKFASRVKPGGLLLYETGTIRQPGTRTDIDIVGIAAMGEALKLKNARTMNMIMLGAYLYLRNAVKIESVLEALKKVLPEKYHHTIPLNEQALERGEELVCSQLKEGVMLVC
jgi:2-oxoglutarate ferredoxin oxidoreductase subunit gamma